MEKNHQSKLSKWLEMLQQESWQLELIISGFAIFLVGSVYEPLCEWGKTIEIQSDGLSVDIIIMLPYIILRGAWFFLMLNLILHVFLRGMWISTIGLRYVSGDIDWQQLNFHPLFDHFLKRKIVSYDDFIERLEKLCSVVFAFTFMIIFSLISFGLWILFLVLIIDILITGFLANHLSEGLYDTVGAILGLIVSLSGFLYFIDFLTLGWLKRRKWLRYIYYPIYRFYTLITLAFLYRPIYYNLIDNKYGRRLMKGLVPYIISIIFLSSFGINYHPYYPDDEEDNTQEVFHYYYYEDLRTQNDNPIISQASIPSKYVTNGFVELFLPYKGRRYNQPMKAICPDFEPIREVGLNHSIIIGFGQGDRKKKKKIYAVDTALFCLKQLYQIQINDTIYQDLNYRFYEHPNNGELGMMTVIDIQDLTRGEYEIKIDYQTLHTDTLTWKNLCYIPFWKE